MRYHEIMETNYNVLNSSEFKSWFAGSKVVTKFGHPRMMYHGTNKVFHEFFPGSHFGTKLAANHRVNDTFGQHGSHIVPVYLSIKYPLRVSDMDASDEATLLNSITRGNYPEIDIHAARAKDAYAAAEDAGYDGLVYKNAQEDRGNLSWVVFRPSQVKSAISGN